MSSTDSVTISLLISCLLLIGEDFVPGCLAKEATALNQNEFPEKFLFGAASASYQVEGAWKADGKGENIWDRFTRERPDKILDGGNGDVACDSYNKYREDVQLVKALGVDFYRFSISWSRILPTGFRNDVNPAGVRYYDDLINELLAHNITPMVTIFHWDLPQPLQEIGGWPNPDLADIFADFADVVFSSYGDRVRHWITFNEAKQICKMGYGDAILAPGFTSSGVGDYMCARTILIAHAKAYHLYNQTYRPTQAGIVGLTFHSDAYVAGSNGSEDAAATQRYFDFYTGLYANPVYGSGDYPQVVRDFIAARSRKQGFTSSRLPALSDEDVRSVRGTADFFGLNYYTALMVNDASEEPLSTVSYDSDVRARVWYNDEWTPAAGSTWLKVAPFGIRQVLNQIRHNYGDVPIIVTENGYSDKGGVEDYDRVNYLLNHLSSCLEALHEDNVNLVGYTVWSLMDNFEWMDGYVNRFGIHDVDFDDPGRPRLRKLSAEYYTEVVRSRRLPRTTVEPPAETTSGSTSSSTKSPAVDIPMEGRFGGSGALRSFGLIVFALLTIGIQYFS